MSYTKRKLEELNVIDDFLMNSLASDSTVGEEFCRILLSTLLQREIGKVSVTVQKAVPPMNPDLRGIRLDVKVEEQAASKQAGEDATMNIYDIEPHLIRGTDLPRHNRFYQALTDSSNLKSGEKDFRRLPDLYILVILDKDPFGYNHMVYSIRNKCQEIEELEYNDGLSFYYFYTDGSKGGSEAIKTMLRYIRDSRPENATDTATKQIHRFTEEIKLQPKVRKGYMFWEEYVEILKEDIADAIRDDIVAEVKEKAMAEAREAVKEKAMAEAREAVKEKVMAEAMKKAEVEVRAESITELLEEYGKLPENLREKIFSEQDLTVLKRWHKAAAKADSIAGFEKAIQPDF